MAEGKTALESGDNSGLARRLCRVRFRFLCQCRRQSRFRHQCRDLRRQCRLRQFPSLRRVVLYLRLAQLVQLAAVLSPEPASHSASVVRSELEGELLLRPHREQESEAARTGVADLLRDHQHPSCLRLRLPDPVRHHLRLASP